MRRFLRYLLPFFVCFAIVGVSCLPRGQGAKVRMCQIIADFEGEGEVLECRFGMDRCYIFESRGGKGGISCDFGKAAGGR
jgi:hypothetical protein